MFSVSNIVLAQMSSIGINTTTPKKTLDVNGSVETTSELNVGGDKIAPVESCKSVINLTPSGPDKAPRWVSPDKVSGLL